MSMTPPPYRPPSSGPVYNLTPDDDLSRLPEPPVGWPGAAAPPPPPPPPQAPVYQPPTWGHQPPAAPPPPAPSSGHAGRIAAALGVLVVLLIGILIGRGTSEDTEVATADASTTTIADDYTPPTTAYRTTTTEDVMSDRELQELALDVTWDKTSPSDRYDICEAVDVFGIATAADIMNGEGGADGSFDTDIIEAKMAEWCQTY